MPSAPTCPRCGYDLTGIADSWTSACPLTGTCSECGHTLEWRIAMRPDSVRLPGLYEHARHWWSLTSAWRTWTWAIRPPVFARKVTVDYQPSIPRLLLWLPVTILPLHIIVALARSAAMVLWMQGLVKVYGTRRVGSPWNVSRHAPFWISPVGHLQSSPFGDRSVAMSWYTFFRSAPAFPWVGLSVMLIIPATLMFMTHTRARSKVRASHILRCTIYGLAWVPLILIITTANAAHTLYLTWTSPAAIGSPGWRPSPISALIFNTYPELWLAGILAWSALWWWYSVVMLLKLHQGWLVWAVMMLIGLITGLMTTAFIEPRWFW